MITKTTKEKYLEKAVPKLMEAFGYKNKMAVPKITKVVVNVGTGKILKEAEKVEEVIKAIAEITGQKPVKTKAKKAISTYKTRKGQEIGVKVTLRGKRMWSFVDRLVNVALPRTRDFQGITQRSVDIYGNFNIGIKEHTIFPEIVLEKVKNIFSLEVNVTSTAKNKKEGEVLFRELGFPIQSDEVNK
jgi:large subunit ribosomal protein L5